MTDLPFKPAAEGQGTTNRYLIVVDYDGLVVNKAVDEPDDPNQIKLRRAVIEAAEYGHTIILASEAPEELVKEGFPETVQDRVLRLKVGHLVQPGTDPADLFKHNGKIVTTYQSIEWDPEAALGVRRADAYIGPRSLESYLGRIQVGEITRPDISQRLRYVLKMQQLPEDIGFVPNAAAVAPAP